LRGKGGEAGADRYGEGSKKNRISGAHELSSIGDADVTVADIEVNLQA
jgi:hypothetical protein